MFIRETWLVGDDVHVLSENFFVHDALVDFGKLVYRRRSPCLLKKLFEHHVFVDFNNFLCMGY